MTAKAKPNHIMNACALRAGAKVLRDSVRPKRKMLKANAKRPPILPRCSIMVASAKEAMLAGMPKPTEIPQSKEIIATASAVAPSITNESSKLTIEKNNHE
jgi:hypothetical protein